MAGVAKHLKGFPRRYAQLKMPWFSQMQILDQPVLQLNPLNFHLFFDFPPAKRVFSTRSSTKTRILRYKIFFYYKKGTAVLKIKKSDTASQHRRPQKKSKSRF
jgi:hypothetical protein